MQNYDDTINELVAVTNALRQDVNRLEGRMDEMAAEMTRMAAEMTRMGGEITRMGGEITRISDEMTRMGGEITHLGGDMTRMGRDVTRMNSRIGSVYGEKYERRIIRRFAPILRRELDASVVEILHKTTGEGHSKLMDLTEAAEAAHRITEADGDDLEDADVAALLDTPGGPRCIAAEISITADQVDIARAAKRAATLGAVTGETPLALVICSELSASNRRLAASRGVAVITRPE